MQAINTLLSPSSPIANRFFLLFLLMFLSPGGGAGTPELSPDEAVRQALLRPDLADIVGADVQSARGSLAEARTRPNPELSLERTSGDLPGRTGDDARIVLSQQFDLSGRRGLQRQAAELGVDAAQAQADADRERIRIEVLTRYYTVVTEQRRRQLLEEWVEELEQIGGVAGRRAGAGDLSGYAARRIQQRGALARSRWESADVAVHKAREQFAALVGIESATLRVETDIDLLPMESELTRALAVPAADHPELHALSRRRDAAEAMERAVGRAPLPVRVGVGQQRQYGQLGHDDALVVEVAVPLPLFNRDQAGRLRAQAELMRAEGLHQRAGTEFQARLRIAQIEASRLVAQARLLGGDLVPETHELASIARASFMEGEIDLPDLLGAIDARIEAVEHMLDLELRASMAWLELDALTRHTHSIPEDHP